VSAIWALLRLDGAPVEAAHLERVSAALKPLGPERADVWREGPVGLGHRLMVFTPEDRADQQPTSSTDGKLVLIYDGRLDNRPELAEVLKLKPAAARLWPDSAYVVRAFQTWGDDTPQYLVGGWALIVWDKPRRRLLAALSPGGSRSLFYHQTAQAVALASLPHGLLALPWVPRQLNASKLAGFLGGGSEADRTNTFFEGIHRLPGGHLLTVADGQVSTSSFWNPDPHHELRLPRDEDYVEAFNALFERVVSDHLRSAAPVAVMMSGGLDSTAVAAVAAPLLQARGEGLLTFTSVPDARAASTLAPGRVADETPSVQAVAAMYTNLSPEFVATDDAYFLDDLDAYFSFNLAPPVAIANRVWLDAILRAASQRGHRVILTGESGNHSLSWSGAGVIAYHLRRRAIGTAWREARALARRGRPLSPWRMLLTQGVLPLLPESATAWLGRLRRPPDPFASSPLRPAYVEAHAVNFRRGQALWHRPRPRRSHGGVSYHATVWRAQFGVDARDPTGDQRVIEFCLSLPHDQFLRDGQPRWLIRRAMAGRLPPEVLHARERGAQGSDWLYRLRQHRAEVAATLEALRQDELARDMLDLDRLGRLIEAWPEPDPMAGLDDPKLNEYAVAQLGLVAGRFILWAHGGS
jgi:asparagine synthase (glutamine-hydrolysing)